MSKKPVVSGKKVVKRNAKGQVLAGEPSLNPAGRPKGSLSIIGRLKQMWEEDPADFEAYVKDIRRDKFLRREIIHHIDGKPKERLELSGNLRLGNMEELSNDELERLAGLGDKS